jgi:Domain of unknown function (DUF3601)
MGNVAGLPPVTEFENLFDVECLRCESCRREFPQVVFTGDTDMLTAGLASLTALTRSEVVLARLTAAEYNLGAAGDALFQDRIARQLSRTDLALVRVKRWETFTKKPKIIHFRFPLTKTIGVYECLYCPEGEARPLKTLNAERFEAKGGLITVAQPPPESKAFKHLAPARRYRVTKSFVDYDGEIHPIGENWIYLSHSFLPHDDGLSLFVSLDGERQRQIRLQWRDEQQGALIENLEDHISSSDLGSLPPFAICERTACRR